MNETINTVHKFFLLIDQGKFDLVKDLYQEIHTVEIDGQPSDLETLIHHFNEEISKKKVNMFRVYTLLFK